MAVTKTPNRSSSRKGGRPSRAPEPGERVQLSLRVTPDIKQRLEAAAAEMGRSLSQEAEMRLEQSFRDDRILVERARVAVRLSELSGAIVEMGAKVGRLTTETRRQITAEVDSAVDKVRAPLLAMLRGQKQVTSAMDAVYHADVEQLAPLEHRVCETCRHCRREQKFSEGAMTLGPQRCAVFFERHTTLLERSGNGRCGPNGRFWKPGATKAWL